MKKLTFFVVTITRIIRENRKARKVFFEFVDYFIDFKLN